MTLTLEYILFNTIFSRTEKKAAYYFPVRLYNSLIICAALSVASRSTLLFALSYEGGS